MIVGVADFFSADYAPARALFRAAAARAGFALESSTIAARGPLGEPLTIDCAFSGPSDPTRALVLSSGLHGIEGFFGSAVQTAWLEAHGGACAPPAGGRIILIHALNPYGFAWLRRANEHNVDLNRNFLGSRGGRPSPDGFQECQHVYERLDPFLNPPSAPSRLEPFLLKAIALLFRTGLAVRRRQPAGTRPSLLACRQLVKLGQHALKQTLPVGQYRYPQGLFFGGCDAEESTRIVQQALPRWVGRALDIVHLDFHTGLGHYADYRLLLTDEPGSAGARWAEGHFDQAHVEPLGGDTAYPERGSMLGYFTRRFSDRQYHALTAEFGTYSPVRVLQALRAENRAFHYGRHGVRPDSWAKRGLKEAFCPADPAWRKAAVSEALQVIEQAAAAVSGGR